MDIKRKQIADFLNSTKFIPEFTLDKDWIIKQNVQAKLYLSSNENHNIQNWFVDASAKGEYISPNPFIDPKYYAQLSNYSEREREDYVLADYIKKSANDDFSLHWLINPEYVKVLNDEVFRDERTVKSLDHNNFSTWFWVVRNRHRVQRVHPLFNEKIYRLLNPDVDLKTCALEDFLSKNIFVGKKTSALFDLDWYKTNYAYLNKSIGIEAHYEHQTHFQHFCQVGIFHDFAPIPDFDAEFYKANNADVVDAVNQGSFRSVTEHFLLFPGMRKPNPYFDPVYYVENNPGVMEEMKALGTEHPLEHFLLIGYRKNYKANRPLHSIDIPEQFSKSIFEKRAEFNTNTYIRMQEKISFSCEKPCYSLVVPVYNFFNFTVNFLVQLYDRLVCDGLLGSVEVIVVDNGSSDSTSRLEGYIDGLVISRHDKPIGYTQACKIGGELAKGEIIGFLNNDIELQRNSLKPLLSHFDDPDVGACGGKIILTDYTLQEAGSHISSSGGCMGFARGKSLDFIPANITREVDYLSGCFIFIRAIDYHEVGGFDLEFSPGYFEETDLCVRLASAGKKIIYEPKSSIMHYEYATYSKGRPPTVSRSHMVRNRKKFISKHSGVLARYEKHEDLAKTALSRKVLSGKQARHILFVEDLLPSTKRGSGFARSQDIVECLLENNCYVSFYVINKMSSDEIDGSWLNDKPVNVYYSTELPFQDLINQIGDQVDLIWLSRTHNINRYGELAQEWRLAGEGRKLIGDTEALASIRSYKLRHDLVDFEISESIIQEVQEEMSSVVSFDALVAVNQKEKLTLGNAFKNIGSFELGHVFYTRQPKLDFVKRANIIFLGAFHTNDCPNMDSVVWFCANVLPIIKATLPKVEFHIAGFLQTGVSFPKIVLDQARYIGAIKDIPETLDKYRLFVAPTRIAGGIPHKVQNAMSNGIPIVLSDVLSCQLQPTQEKSPFVVSELKGNQFAEACIDVYKNEKKWQKISEQAIKEIEKTCSSKLFSKKLEEILDV